MDFRDVVRLALEEYREELQKALDGLTPAELRWQPGPNSNHALWLAWHIARVEDSWVNSYVAGAPTVWTAEGWAERMQLPAGRGGYGDTAEDVASFPDVDLGEITAYHNAVRSAALPVIAGLSAADLALCFEGRRRGRRGAPTVAWVLSHLIVEEAQHVGQIAFLRGMLRGLNR